MALLDVAARDVRTAGEVVDVQLDRGGAGVLHRAGVTGPALGRDTVEACDHRDIDRGDGALEQDQVGVGAAVLFGHGGEVAERLREALGGLVDEPAVRAASLSQLLLEQREQDDRADAAVRQPPHAVERVGQRRRRTPRGGCAVRDPCSWSRGPSASPAGVRRELARAAGRHLLVQPPALVDDLLARARAGARPRSGGRPQGRESAARPCGSPPATSAAGASRAGRGCRHRCAAPGHSGSAASDRWPRRRTAGSALRAGRIRARRSGCRR